MSQVFSRDIKLFRVQKKFNLIYSITVTNDSFGIIPGFHLLSFTYFLPFSGRITDNQLHSKQFFESLRFSFCIRHLLIAFVFKKCCICRQNRGSFVKSGSEQRGFPKRRGRTSVQNMQNLLYLLLCQSCFFSTTGNKISNWKVSKFSCRWSIEHCA